MPTGLIRRGARYSVRRRIPLDLVGHYGRKEITRALDTPDPKEARKLLPLAWAALDIEFEQARAALASDAQTVAPAADVDPAVVAAKMVAALRLKREKAAIDGTLEDLTQHMRDQLLNHQAVLDGAEEPSWSMARHEGIRNGLRAALTGEGAMSIGAYNAPAAPTARDDENPKMQQLLALWTKHQERPRSTLQGMHRAVDRFEQVIGEKRVKAVTRRDMTTFTDKMREPGAVTPTGVSIPNMNTTLSLLSALFGFAVRRNLIETNPATNTQIQDPRRAREKRTDFDLPALEAIFGGSVYAAGERPQAGAGEAAYWIPLLALYTGARINELCQLHPADVVQEGYVDAKGQSRKAWVVRIVQDRAKGQRVKTEGSERRIPIHPDLIKLGFIAYATAQHGSLLFEGLTAERGTGRMAGSWGRWFGRYLRKECGVTDERMTFQLRDGPTVREL